MISVVMRDSIVVVVGSKRLWLPLKKIGSYTI